MEHPSASYKFVSATQPCTTGPVTVEAMEYWIASARAEGLPEDEVQDLITPLRDLKSGAATLPEPGVTYFEKALPDGGVWSIYATARLENPEQELERMPLDELVPVHPVEQD